MKDKEALNFILKENEYREKLDIISMSLLEMLGSNKALEIMTTLAHDLVTCTSVPPKTQIDNLYRTVLNTNKRKR